MSSKSEKLVRRALKVAPGGVHTSLRRIEPLIIWSMAKGSKLYAVDGKEYIDYHCAFGPVILGHCHPKVNKAVIEQVECGDIFGAGSNELEIKVAEKIVKYVPSAEMVLFCNAGSEATYHAIRVSRAVTKRKKVIKFNGHYHGWHDYLNANYLTPPSHFGKIWPESAGMLESTIEQIVPLPFNDIDAVENAIKKNRGEIAAMILEPIMHNVGCIMPKEGYLKALRELSDKNDILLIFDEVITGFRHALGGVQKIFGVTPDITTFAKAMANGYPIASICAREEIMKRFKTDKAGDVFFAGSYNAHPISMAAALATIEELENPKVYQHLFKLGDNLRAGLSKAVEESGLKAQVRGFGSVFTIYFSDLPINNYEELILNTQKSSDLDVSFRNLMIKKGIFLIPFSLKRNYISASHTDDDIKKTIDATYATLSTLKANQ